MIKARIQQEDLPQNEGLQHEERVEEINLMETLAMTMTETVASILDVEIALRIEIHPTITDLLSLAEEEEGAETQVEAAEAVLMEEGINPTSLRLIYCMET